MQIVHFVSTYKVSSTLWWPTVGAVDQLHWWHLIGCNSVHYLQLRSQVIVWINVISLSKLPLFCVCGCSPSLYPPRGYAGSPCFMLSNPVISTDLLTRRIPKYFMDPNMMQLSTAVQSIIATAPSKFQPKLWNKYKLNFFYDMKQNLTTTFALHQYERNAACGIDERTVCFQHCALGLNYGFRQYNSGCYVYGRFLAEKLTGRLKNIHSITQ